MVSDEDIASAVQEGVISSDAAAALRAHAARRQASPPVDEEHFRLVTGFNDIFVVIACVLLLTAVYWLGRSLAPAAGPLGVGAASWLLAEFFVRRRRMALPAIVLLLCFVGSAFEVGQTAARAAATGGEVSLAAGCMLAAVAAWVHWLRFHVPITVAAGTGVALVAAIVVVVRVAAPRGGLLPELLVFLSGVAAFALAMAWDISDRARTTRRADVAFWLHLLAAPLLVHPVFTAIGVLHGGIGSAQALLIVALYCAIALVSLAIDRRALMVSALGYVLYAFSTLLDISGMVGKGFATTALCIGAALLLLSAFWQRSRACTVGFLPAALRSRLPPLQASMVPAVSG